jgi:hypothetical protein
MLHGRKAATPLFAKRHTPDESRQIAVAARKVVVNVRFLF